ncbi:MAG: SMC-Scp complex subunit ScpB [Bacteroidota bacterium]
MSDAQTGIKIVDVEVSTELKNIIEAVIFASDEPMTVRFIRAIVDDVNKDIPPEQQLVLNAEIIRKAVADLNRGYGRLGSGFRIIEVAGGFVFATQEQFASWVGKLAKERARRRLSPTAVETLAIIAYKQPITKAEVEFIRGVNVDYIINALLEKDLIQITGRQNSPGRPLLYGTTQKFLEHFGLNELTDLPKPREISELISETEIEVDRRLLAEQQELEFQEGLDKKLEGHEGAAKKEKTPKQPRTGTKRSRSETTEPSAEPVGSLPAEIQPEHRPEEETVAPAESAGPSTPAMPMQTLDAANNEIVEEGARQSTVQTEIEKADRQDPISGGAEHVRETEHDVDTDRPDLAAEHEADRDRETVTGWSKWKTKVKTFFKKLFG